MIPECPNCNSFQSFKLFSKKAPDQKEFTLTRCKSCKVIYLNPFPNDEYLKAFYENHYFLKRSDRGYDNYYSEETRQQIEKVWGENLRDLKFQAHDWIENSKRSLDIGCAAGYYVAYMQKLGFQSKGIDIAESPTQFARVKLNQDVITGEFLNWDQGITQHFEVISLWATIEHLTNPFATLTKISNHLTKNGILLLSTCRWGILSRILKSSWRFCNVPEHIFYFEKKLLFGELEKRGLRVQEFVTYGSGLTTKKDAGSLYKWSKKVLDPLVKFTNQGDMIAILAKKI